MLCDVGCSQKPKVQVTKKAVSSYVSFILMNFNQKVFSDYQFNVSWISTAAAAHRDCLFSGF